MSPHCLEMPLVVLCSFSFHFHFQTPKAWHFWFPEQRAGLWARHCPCASSSPGSVGTSSGAVWHRLWSILWLFIVFLLFLYYFSFLSCSLVLLRILLCSLKLQQFLACFQGWAVFKWLLGFWSIIQAHILRSWDPGVGRTAGLSDEIPQNWFWHFFYFSVFREWFVFLDWLPWCTGSWLFQQNLSRADLMCGSV